MLSFLENFSVYEHKFMCIKMMKMAAEIAKETELVLLWINIHLYSSDRHCLSLFHLAALRSVSLFVAFLLSLEDHNMEKQSRKLMDLFI